MGFFRDMWAFSRLKPEQRSVLTAGILSQTLLGRPNVGGSSSSTVVSEHNAMAVTAIYACVKVLMETVASLPLDLFERMPDDSRRLARNHYAFPLLGTMPNPEMTSHEVREYIMASLCLWGNAYLYTPRDGAGQVLEMWPIPPQNVLVNRDGHELRYRVAMPEAIQKRTGKQNWNWSEYNVLHIRGLTMDGLMGMSPIDYNRNTIGLYMNAQQYGTAFYENGARPGGVLEYDKSLNDEQFDRLSESANARFAGVDNAYRLMVLEHGVKYKPVAIPPNDAQYIETRKFGLLDIARIYRMPPHMIGDLENATYSNIEHQSISFVTNTLMPWLNRIEQAINMRLLRPEERKRFFCEFNTNALVRGDIEARYKAYATGRQWTWLTPNDIRKMENMPPVPGGDVLHQPLNMIPLGGVPDDTDAKEAREFAMRQVADAFRIPPEMLNNLDNPKLRSELRAAGIAKSRRKLAKNWEPVLRDALSRVYRREAADIGRQATKHFKTRNVDEFTAWLNDFYREHGAFVVRVILPVLLSYGEMVIDLAADEAGADRDSLTFDKFIRAFAEAFALRHGQINLKRLMTALEGASAEAGDQLEAVEDVLESFKNEDGPATASARNESNRLTNALALAVYKGAGFREKTWRANKPSCPYCEALDGTTVSISENFIHGGEGVDGKGGDVDPLVISRSIGHPPAHRGCDCMVTAG